ncbi:putative inner membrane protein [Pelagimonas phthalicica]|uniref:Putative inner membrane protein n=1 Tax=Pelagimonas phthalicica TaxID=1037362 RepID=A0A238JHS3_9RHOB|nr:YeeE/YedE family protein [Pelagimonas phthalicica]TDS89775.1 sulfur transporter [Pelagimonas phthalicica]SMX29943.1 putative inner membrane protein [Pelagimonas phthalicica]
MDLVPLVERIGESPTAALFGLITGLIFGVAAQRSRFCLRAATVEFARGHMQDKVAVWLLTFSTAVVWVQGAQLLGFLDTSEARMMAVPGSWSGAIIGGLLFGAGMVLARGCSGRLLVLAATGNMRSIVSGLIFAVVAQMSLTGWLAPVRDFLARLWVTSGGRNMDLLAAVHLPKEAGLMIGLLIALLALELSRRNRIGFSRLVFASGVGFAAALGYGLTFALSQVAFDPVQIESLTFTGPSANTLMFLLDRNSILEFDIGLVPGVVIGSFVSAILAREFQFQAFEGASPMRRAMIGAVMMGFGGMLAGGCAIGAGVSGGSIFAGTAWLALFAMWIGGMTMDTLLGGERQAVAA